MNGYFFPKKYSETNDTCLCKKNTTLSWFSIRYKGKFSILYDGAVIIIKFFIEDFVYLEMILLLYPKNHFTSQCNGMELQNFCGYVFCGCLLETKHKECNLKKPPTSNGLKFCTLVLWFQLCTLEFQQEKLSSFPGSISHYFTMITKPWYK